MRSKLSQGEVMSKFREEEIIDGVWPVASSQVNHLIGELLTFIEAWGDSPQTQKARKDLTSQTIWKWFCEIETSYMPVEARLRLNEPCDYGTICGTATHDHTTYPGVEPKVTL